MALYASLASSYDDLFPPNPEATAFLEGLAASLAGAGSPGAHAEGLRAQTEGLRAQTEGLRALDLGCATGSQALALAARGWTVLGIDSEEAMVSRAREKALREGLSHRASFLCADALGLGRSRRQALGPLGFDLVLCLGNTLPHFRGEGASAFLSTSLEFLAPGGALVLQTVNYSLPGLGPGHSFPPLRAGGTTMLRRYEASTEESGTLRFVVELEGVGGREVDETLLEPRSPALLASLLAKAGFSAPRLFSGWEGGPFEPLRDPYLIAVAGAAGKGDSR
jgi:glycine/sarcosine N-methyltransferase